MRVKELAMLYSCAMMAVLILGAIVFALRVSRERQPMPPSPPAESHGEAKPIRVVASKRSLPSGADDAVPEDVSSVIAVVCEDCRVRLDCHSNALSVPPTIARCSFDIILPQRRMKYDLARD